MRPRASEAEEALVVAVAGARVVPRVARVRDAEVRLGLVQQATRKGNLIIGRLSH